MSSYEAAHHSRDEPPYLAPYGLQTAPFPSQHDDRFLYLDANRQQQLEMLRELTGYNQLLLTVIGEWGIGKTSLKQRYINTAAPDWLISEINGHPMMDAEELLSTIAQGFGFIDIPASPAELQNNLYQYLASLQHKDTIPVLVVDDAHELSQEALEALFYLSDAEASEGNLLRTILFCEPSISVMLDSTAIEPLKQRITHSMKLTPFDEQQTAEYLRHRMAVAGLEGSSPFSPTEIKRIYNASEGIPEKINETAHLVLCGDELDDLDILDDITEEESTAARSLNLRHVIIGAVTILVIAAVLLWREDIRQLFNKPAATSIASVTEDNPQPSETGGAVEQEAAAEKTIQLGIAEPVQQATINQEVESNRAKTEETTASGTTEPVSAAGLDEQKPAPTLVVSAIEPDPVPASDKQQTLTLKGEGFDATTRITVEWANQRKTLLQNRLHLVNENRLDFDITVGTKPDTWVVIVRNPQTGGRATTQFVVKPVATKTATPAADHPDSLDDLAWLKRQPANHFTLQLLASPQITSLQEFVKQHDLAGKAVMFETRAKDGKPWYALAHGSYPSRQAAEQASQALPAGIKPWIRRFASIQEGLARPPVSVLPAKSVPQGNNLQDHAAWLWAQDPSHYTLQLLAGRNEQAVTQFIARHHLAGQAVFYQTTREDKPWYVLVMGSFADRARALGARDKLPADLRQQSPWPRAFSEVHADLSRH